jgi:hypothetical protein
MEKKQIYSLTIFMFFSVIVNGQIGISTSNPQGVFNIDGAKDNPSTGTPTAIQQENDVSVTATGSVGIGTTAPTNKLHIVTTTDPMRLQGVATGVTTSDRLLVIDGNGVVKNIGTLSSLSVPNPAVFRLETTQSNFLSSQGSGGSQTVPMSVIKNSIPGLTYNSATSTITFPAGTYQMTFVYEGLHSATDCTISSYFIDFPLNSTTTRIHSTASHVQGGISSHGGTITYATTVPADRTWQIHLGRGQSGNCGGAGMTLSATSTQLLVFRIGD